MIACREPEEDLEETQDEPVPIATEQDVLQEEFWDDRTGKLLDSEKVRAARAEELRELDRRVWVEADVEECWNKKGRGPIGVRWVDVDKGFGVYRSRLVAKDFKPKSKVNDQEGLFAATPPLELVKMLILKAARGSRNRHAGVRKVMFLDVSKAHLYAPMLDEDFVQLPPERWTEVRKIDLHTLWDAYQCKQLGEGVQQHFRDGGFLSRACDCSCFLPRGTRGEDRRAR